MSPDSRKVDIHLGKCIPLWNPSFVCIHHTVHLVSIWTDEKATQPQHPLARLTVHERSTTPPNVWPAFGGSRRSICGQSQCYPPSISADHFSWKKVGVPKSLIFEVTWRTKSPFAAKWDSQDWKNSSMYSCPTASSISLIDIKQQQKEEQGLDFSSSLLQIPPLFPVGKREKGRKYWPGDNSIIFVDLWQLTIITEKKPYMILQTFHITISIKA